MPSFLENLFVDYIYGVRGLLRKKARHRCLKRGEDFDEYNSRVKEIERELGEKRFQEQLNEPSRLFSDIQKCDGWSGGDMIVPFNIGPAQPIRKRAKWRNK